jgi:hypothetical protein
MNNKSQTKQCIRQTRDTLPSSSPATLVAAINMKAAQHLAPSHLCMPSLPVPNSGPSTIVFGSKEKKCILEEYKSKFASGHQELIITKKKGKLDHNEPLQSLASSRQCMKPSTNKYYQVKELTIYNVITIVIRDQRVRGFLQQVVKHFSVEYQLCKDDAQAPTIASDSLFFITQAGIELQKSNAD